MLALPVPVFSFMPQLLQLDIETLYLRAALYFRNPVYVFDLITVRGYDIL
jgi:hypothetical protein